MASNLHKEPFDQYEDTWVPHFEKLPPPARLEAIRALLPACAWACGECSRCRAYEELRWAERTVTLWGHLHRPPEKHTSGVRDQ